MVMVDRLFKSTHFGDPPTNFTASDIIELFVFIMVWHHEFSRSIVSEHDPNFFSTDWHNLFELTAMKLSMSNAYHPQTRGHTKVVNHGLE